MSDRLSYSELIKYDSFRDRYNYLRLSGKPGRETFDNKRWINQDFYHSLIWKRTRRDIIIRDNGCDLGVPGHELNGAIYIHHMNPITIDDFSFETSALLDPENLICVSLDTHNAIHYGNELGLPYEFNQREPGDTKLW